MFSDKDYTVRAGIFGVLLAVNFALYLCGLVSKGASRILDVTNDFSLFTTVGTALVGVGTALVGVGTALVGNYFLNQYSNGNDVPTSGSQINGF
ncbi:MAG: hypothetical protein AAF153_00875 [Pseudomonadota bacterium]